MPLLRLRYGGDNVENVLAASVRHGGRFGEKIRATIASFKAVDTGWSSSLRQE